jgi:hypothetical protein
VPGSGNFPLGEGAGGGPSGFVTRPLGGTLPAACGFEIGMSVVGGLVRPVAGGVTAGC